MKILFLSTFIALSLLILSTTDSTDPIIRCNNQEICEIQHLSLEEGQPLELNVANNYAQYQNIMITDSQIHTIPLELLDIFPNMKNFSAAHCRLKTIDKAAIGAKLHHLSLPSNVIATLDDYMFEKGKALITIDLSQNWITVVARNAFRFLADLNKLDLSYNRICSLAKDTFSDLKQLDTLKLGHNAIRTVEYGLFRENLKLIILEMEKNEIRMLPDHLFHGLDHLNIIDLSENEIETIEPEAFEGLVTIKTLDLRGNRLKAWGTVLVTGTIEHLYLHNNHIEFADFDGLRNSVIDLQLNSNRVRSIRMTQNNSKMTTLNLDNNQLSTVADIRKLRRLEVVNLSNNPDLNLLPGTIAGLQSLRALFLKAVGSINLNGSNTKWFEHLPFLEELDLSYNNLPQLDVAAFAPLQNLTKLNLESANITEILNYDKLSLIFPKLLGVNLLGNNCERLESFSNFLKERNIMINADCDQEGLVVEYRWSEANTTTVATGTEADDAVPSEKIGVVGTSAESQLEISNMILFVYICIYIFNF